MEQARLQKAMEIFEVPEEFYGVAPLMVHDAEWELILAMEKRIVPESEVIAIVEKNRLAGDAPDFIKDCYRRAILNKMPGGHAGLNAYEGLPEDAAQPPAEEAAQGMSWQVTNFYARYPYFAQYEYYEYGKLPREVKERLNAWDLKVYVGIFGDDVRAKMRGEDTHVHNSTFLTLEEAYAFAEKHKDTIHLHACNCKCMMYYHDRPTAVCMEFYDGPNSEADRGHGVHLTLEQAKAKLKEFNQKGLMQNGEDYAICNCDGYCCYPLQMARQVGSQGVYPKSHYNIDWHEDECINCGKCTKICNFHAFTRDEATKKVSYHRDLCWGCTICAPNCPKGAIHLIPKEEA